RIVDGLIVALLALTNGKSPAEILATDYEQQFARLGLQAHLVPQRRNGLFSMVERVRAIARALAETTAAPTAAIIPKHGAPLVKSDALALPVTSTDDKRKHEPLDVDAVRRQFPALHQMLEGGVPVTYLDSASSTQKPQCVIDKEVEVYEQYNANGYRGVYRFGDRISRELEDSRERIRRFVGAASTDEVIFTSGTTMGINLVANAWGRRHLKPGDEILLNEVEHHANFVPWQWIAEQTGAVLKFIPLTDDL